MFAMLVGFWAAFFVGGLLVTIGLLGASIADCPALMTQFPAAAMRCNAFTACTFVGGAAVLVGGIAAVGMMAYADTHPDSRVGRNLWAAEKAN